MLYIVLVRSGKMVVGIDGEVTIQTRAFLVNEKPPRWLKETCTIYYRGAAVIRIHVAPEH